MVDLNGSRFGDNAYGHRHDGFGYDVYVHNRFVRSVNNNGVHRGFVYGPGQENNGLAVRYDGYGPNQANHLLRENRNITNTNYNCVHGTVSNGNTVRYNSY